MLHVLEEEKWQATVFEFIYKLPKRAWKYIDEEIKISNTCDLVLELCYLKSLQTSTLIGKK